ncbi:MAG: hypothetical protein IPO83_11665 [Chitinophagaceae bacterium]|nr:hypothetical protein [Chitinophagaceae bacterium]
MKRFVKMFAILAVITTSMWVIPAKASAQIAVSYQLFYDQLSPYGSWVSYPNHGYVWLPNAGPGFSPYATAGHWIFTEYGWTWVSDYSWGWAAFHYGRWLFDPFYGWLWVPDSVWGPAWVVWRSSPDYYGWAPLKPGISINAAFGTGYKVPNEWWVFAPSSHITRRDIPNYYAPRTNNVTNIKNTAIINRTYVNEKEHITYSYGPDRDVAQKVTGTPIIAVTIKDRSTPGESMSNGQLSIYKPRVEKTYANGSTPVPKKVTDLAVMKKKEPASIQSSLQDQPKSNTSVKTSPATKQIPVQSKEEKPANNNVKQPNIVAPPKREPKQVNPQPKLVSLPEANFVIPSIQQVAKHAANQSSGQFSASTIKVEKVKEPEVKQQLGESFVKRKRLMKAEQ